MVRSGSEIECRRQDHTAYEKIALINDEWRFRAENHSVLDYSRRQFGGDFDCLDRCLQIIDTGLRFGIVLLYALQSSGKLDYYRLMPLMFCIYDLHQSLRQVIVT